MTSSFRDQQPREIADEAQAADEDPTQLILPEVDTDIPLWRGQTWDELVMFIPGVIAALAAAALYFVDRGGLAVLLLVTGAVLFIVATWLRHSTEWYTTPTERLLEWMSYRRLRWRLPFGPHESVDKTHGVERVAADGSVVCRDGRRVALVPVRGTNTDRLSAGEEARLVGRLTEAIDEEMKDFAWAYTSQSRRSDTEELAEHRADRAENAYEHGLTGLQREVLFDSADWLREQDDRWDANEWHHYIEVAVHPHEVPSESVGEQLRSTIPFVSGETADETPNVTAAELLTRRVETVQGALAGIEGIASTRATAAELVDVGLHYWSSGDHDPSSELIEKFAYTRDGSPTPAEQALAPDGFDVHGATIELEDEYARTYWISEWPTNPETLFLGDLFTADSVDVDVKVYAEPRHSRDVRENYLEREIARIDAEGMERAENTDVSALTIDDELDAYVLGYSLLEQTNAQPWRLNGYVTVRADTEQGLNEAAEEIRQTLEASPANAWPVASGTRQKTAFASAAPFARDLYAEGAREDRRRFCLGGALGAMFPFGAPSLNEEGGIRWGRNTLTGEQIVASPFERGTAPHWITFGASRSGKTYGISAAEVEWFLDEDDRTLIVCDTQGEFDGVTKLCGGEHIVIDGSKGINPLDIRPMPEHVREATSGGYNAYRLKIDEATEFLAGILRAQGVDPSPYVATIEEALEATYRERGGNGEGITSDPDTHDRESPTIADYLDVLGEMLEDAEEHTFTGHDREIEVTESRVADLLDRLSGFREGGKYHHLVGETDTGLGPDTRMAYLDLRQLQGQADADRSVMLHLMLSQVSQLIKQTPGETIFAIDEAHHLLHSEDMVEWLQQAAREWARFDAALHFISQSPQEFVRRSTSVEAGQENHRQTLVEQSSIIQVFSSPRTSEETLRELGLDNAELVRTAKDRLTPGWSGKGFSESLVQFGDQRGWMESWVEAPPLLHRVLTYNSREHSDFEEFVLADRPGRPTPQPSEGEETHEVAADGGEEDA